MIAILRIIDENKSNEWNDCVRSFHNWDVYYMYEYVYPLAVHNGADMKLIYYEDDEIKEERTCYAVLQKDVSEASAFLGLLDRGMYFDWETPYGYGGPLLEKALSEASSRRFVEALRAFCAETRVVTQFVRFHPYLENENSVPGLIERRYMRDTITIDTSCEGNILGNMDSKCRNMIRKAEKNGVTIHMASIDDYDEFAMLYEITMTRLGADEAYFFGQAYYEAMRKMRDNAFILYALHDGDVVAGAMFMYNHRYMHYHLSASDPAYRNLAATNLILYHAAKWAAKNGIILFHLGGGVTGEDSLFGFKKQFNKNGRKPFYIGRTIFDQEGYNYLLKIRKEEDPCFDENNQIMIQYRR